MMTENNLKLNREYKDALFKFIFGNEARKNLYDNMEKI